MQILKTILKFLFKIVNFTASTLGWLFILITLFISLHWVNGQVSTKYGCVGTECPVKEVSNAKTD